MKRIKLAPADHGRKLSDALADPLVRYGVRFLRQDGGAEVQVQSNLSGQWNLLPTAEGWEVRFYSALAY
jgi:hypothetical protein